jgi:hypothetical protein
MKISHCQRWYINRGKSCVCGFHTEDPDKIDEFNRIRLERKAAASRKWRESHPGYSKGYRDRNPEKRIKWLANRRAKLAQSNFAQLHREKNYLWNQNNFLKHMLIGAKSRAKRKGLEFSLVLSDLIMPELCPILGIKLVTHHETDAGNGQGHNRFDESPSLDRIDNDKGYVPGNVRIISWRANHLKSDGTADEHEKIAFYIRQSTKAIL